MVLAFVQARRIVQRAEVAVNARAHEAVARQFFQFLAVFALSAAHDRREDHHAVVGLGQFSLQDGAHNLVGGLARDGLAAFRAVRRADRAVNHAQVIVNFSDGADRGARRARGGFLLDGDGGRKPFDRIHFRAFHLVQKLAGVGRKRLHVAALPLGVNRVKRKRGFARAGKPGDHGQGVPWNLQADIFQVVLARAADNDFLQAHGRKLAPTDGWAHSG